MSFTMLNHPSGYASMSSNYAYPCPAFLRHFSYTLTATTLIPLGKSRCKRCLALFMCEAEDTYIRRHFLAPINQVAISADQPCTFSMKHTFAPQAPPQPSQATAKATSDTDLLRLLAYAHRLSARPPSLFACFRLHLRLLLRSSYIYQVLKATLRSCIF